MTEFDKNFQEYTELLKKFKNMVDTGEGSLDEMMEVEIRLDELHKILYR